MSALSIRRIEPELQAWLREQAAAHGVSMEEEVRNLLRAARDAAEERRRAEEQAAWQALLALAYKPPPGSPDAATLLREDRDGH